MLCLQFLILSMTLSQMTHGESLCVTNPKTIDHTDIESNQCGIEAKLQPSMVIGGGFWRASVAEVPWHAAVYLKTHGGMTTSYTQICGGTLIKPTLVISAAHCFWNEDASKLMPASRFAVAVGKLFRQWSEDFHDIEAQKSNVSEIMVPPHFQGHATNLQEDIALVIVKSPFKYNEDIRPACLDFDIELDEIHLKPESRLGKVAGWGLTSENGAASPTLQVATMPVVELQKCFQQTGPGFRAYITADKFCAGYNNGTAVCKGDSGGGFFIPEYEKGQARYYLRGIVSGAPQNENLCNLYTWATFTRVNKHERFIKKTLEEIAATASKVTFRDSL